MWRNFRGSGDYWEQRYREGGNSGTGSYGALAEFKAATLNRFVKEQKVRSLIEFGCGDGNQLSLSAYPRYVGLDVARKAIQLCKTRFAGDPTKSFFLYDPDCFVDNAHFFRCDAALSLDVLFHLVEDDVFERYLDHLFQSGAKHVIIYSSNTDLTQIGPHEKHRHFTEYVSAAFAEWKLVERIANPFPLSKFAPPLGSLADFYFYERLTNSSAHENVSEGMR
jgi:SAM-dependent methyltransferase